MDQDVFLVKEVNGQEVTLGPVEAVREYWKSKIQNAKWSRDREGIGHVGSWFLVEFGLNLVMPKREEVREIHLTVRGGGSSRNLFEGLCVDGLL